MTSYDDDKLTINNLTINNRTNNINIHNSDSKIYKYVITKYITNRYDKKGKYIPLSYSLNKNFNKNICINTIKFNKIIHECNGIYLYKILSSDILHIKYPIDKLLTYLLNIFEFVKILNNNNIIHLNIKAESIIITDRRAKLCNFEYSIDANTLYTDKETILQIEWRCGDKFDVIMQNQIDYFLLPPELIIHKICDNRLKLRNKLKNYYSIINDIIIKQDYLTNNINSIRNNYNRYYTDVFKLLKSDIYLNTDYNKVDVYSLGMLLEELLFSYIGSGNIPYNVQTILYELFILIIDMKKIRVRDRITINQAINRYKSIINDMDNYIDINYNINDLINNLFL